MTCPTVTPNEHFRQKHIQTMDPGTPHASNVNLPGTAILNNRSTDKRTTKTTIYLIKYSHCICCDYIDCFQWVCVVYFDIFDSCVLWYIKQGVKVYNDKVANKSFVKFELRCNCRQWNDSLKMSDINTMRPGQDGRHFPDDIFKCIFLDENV